MNSCLEISKKWNENSGSYKTKEIGSGVHSFIKDMLLSDELFNLKEKPSRSKEFSTFTHDTASTENGRPDFIIYISKNIEIVCEVKCFGRIEEGYEQILRYQEGYNRKYGILTDGYEWRFYNDSSYKSITLDDILNNTSKFHTLWNEYKAEENYYTYLFDKESYLFDMSINADDGRQYFFESITNLIINFKNKLDLANYFKDNLNKEKISTEISYAYLIQFILYKSLVDNNYGDFQKDFDERLDVIRSNLVSGINSYRYILNTIKNISNKISDNIYKPFNEEQALINDKLKNILNKPKSSLSDISLWLDIILFIRKFNFSNMKNEIFGFVY